MVEIDLSLTDVARGQQSGCELITLEQVPMLPPLPRSIYDYLDEEGEARPNGGLWVIDDDVHRWRIGGRGEVITYIQYSEVHSEGKMCNFVRLYERG